MRAETSLERAIRKYEKDPEFVLEGILWDLNDQIARAMKNQNISRAKLADRLGTSRSYVTKLLRGTTNITLQSLARVAIALGSEISISLSGAQQPTKVNIRTAAASPRLRLLEGWGTSLDRAMKGRAGAAPLAEFAPRGRSKAHEGEAIRFLPTSFAGTELPGEQANHA